MAKWYLIDKGEKVGPITKKELKSYNPTGDTLVFAEGMVDFQPLSTVDELKDLLNNMEKEIEQKEEKLESKVDSKLNQVFGVDNPNIKNKNLTAVFCLLGGLHGLHYAYLGKEKATLYCLAAVIICVLLFWLFIPILLLLLLCAFNFVCAIMIFIMSKEKFEEKFVNSPKTFPLPF